MVVVLPLILTSLTLFKKFCLMHLGVNLRKAFLSGSMPNHDDNTDEAAVSGKKYPSVDVLVHEFCKLFGKARSS